MVKIKSWRGNWAKKKNDMVQFDPSISSRTKLDLNPIILYKHKYSTIFSLLKMSFVVHQHNLREYIREVESNCTKPNHGASIVHPSSRTILPMHRDYIQQWCTIRLHDIVQSHKWFACITLISHAQMQFSLGRQVFSLTAKWSGHLFLDRKLII